MTPSALTLAQARQALDRCSETERELLRGLDEHETNLVLEAKVYADATLSDGWPVSDELAERRRIAGKARADFQRIMDRAEEAG